MPSWPLVGRTKEVAAALDHLQDERGLVFVGAAGVGKSHLVRGILGEARERGWRTESFTATPGAASVPFAPFAGLCDEQDQDPMARLVHARRSLIGDGGPVVIAIDDADKLDDVSVGFVRGLLADTDVRVVLTVRTGSHAVPLWTDELRRAEVVPLTRDDVEELVTAAVENDVDPEVTRWVWTVTAGNPLFVRELITDALERDALVERGGRVVRTPDAAEPGARVQEVIAARIGALDDDERSAVELIALGEPIGLALVESIVGADALQSLERRALVRSDRLDRRVEVRLAHPLHAEVTRSLIGPSTASSHRRRLLAALVAWGTKRRDDDLQLALWRLENGDVSDWRAMLDAAQEVSRRSYARLRTDLEPLRQMVPAGVDSRELAIRLARAALIASGSAEAAALLAWMLARIGRPEEGLAVAASMDALVHDDEDLVIVAKTQADLELMLTADTGPALARLEEVERRVVDPRLMLKARGTRAAIVGLLGQMHASFELGLSVFRDERADRDDRLMAIALAASALGPVGRVVEGHALLEEANALVVPETSSAPLAALMLGKITLLAVEGRLAEMEQLCSLSLAITEQVDSEEGIAIFSAMSAQCALGGGGLLTALRLADQALRRMVDIDTFGIRMIAYTARATALGYLGRPEEAAAALDDLRAEARPGPFSSQAGRAVVWCEVALGRLSAARRTLADGIELARDDGYVASEIPMLHDLVRIGSFDVVDRLEEIVPLVAGAYPPLVLSHARGLATADSSLVEAAAIGHTEMGAHLYAAECWAQAAGIHRRAGRKGDANDAAGHSRAAIAMCEGPPSTPALVQSEPLGSLTKREQEIVSLAAEGLTDKEIAERLVVSARTVQTHLYNAYAKLGVEGRDDLTAY